MTLKLKRPAALLEGGPRDGWAYYVDSLEELVRIESRCGRRFPYEHTDRRAVHPRAGGKITSEVWAYTPQSVQSVQSDASGPTGEPPENDPWAGM